MNITVNVISIILMFDFELSDTPFSFKLDLPVSLGMKYSKYYKYQIQKYGKKINKYYSIG